MNLVTITVQPPPSTDLGLLAQIPPIVLSGIIAAIVSVIIAVVSSRSQARRERERDEAQREDQRQRDHDQWKREDQHRFGEHKREIYLKYLIALGDYEERADDYLSEVRRERGPGLDVVNNLYDAMHAAYEESNAARRAIELVGSVEVLKMALGQYIELQKLHQLVQVQHIEILQDASLLLSGSKDPAAPREDKGENRDFAIAEIKERLGRFETTNLLIGMRRDVGAWDIT